MILQEQEKEDLLRQRVRQIVQEHFLHRVQAIDNDDEFPPDLVTQFYREGFMSFLIPREYGGESGTVTNLCIIIEELSTCSGSFGLLPVVQAVGILPILLAGTPMQKEQFLSQVIHSRHLVAFALTEPKAGSDVAAITSHARLNGKSYLVSGGKAFVTCGNIASWYVVFAKTDLEAGHKGISAFLVRKTLPGIKPVQKNDLIGMRGIPNTGVSFEKVEVPKDCLLGKEGEGFKLAMKTLDISRPMIAAQALGIAQGALDIALRHANQREVFGKPLSRSEGVQFLLADMAMQVESARSLVYKAARMVDGKIKGATKFSAMAKCLASDVAMRVTTDAFQVLGGYALIKGRHLERMMRDAKVTQIYEGSNQIQRLVIARELIKEYERSPEHLDETSGKSSHH